MRVRYIHPSKKFVYFSAPENMFETCKRWLDFCLTTYPLQDFNGVDVRFQKRDHFRDMGGKKFELYGGIFKSKWIGTADIAVCLGKTFTSPEEEVMSIFFHEYGHCLQRDQGRNYAMTAAEEEADANAFAEDAMKVFKISTGF